MDYIGTIRRGWVITWNNKWLWVLGFLAALGSGTSLFNYSFNGGDGQGMGLGQWMTPGGAAALTAALTAFACVAFIIGVLLWLVSLAARGGLIRGVVELDGGRKPTLGEAFRAGWAYVWRLAGMTILLYLAVILLFVLIGVAVAAFLIPVSVVTNGASEPNVAALTGLGFGGLVLVCLLCLIVPLAIVLSFIYPFAMRGIVLRDMGVRDSIRHGWRVLRDNLGEILLLALAFLILNLVFGLLAFVILLPIGLVIGVPVVLLGQANATVLQGILAVLGGLLYLVIIAAVSALVTSWQSATFTLAYQQWTGKNFAPAKGVGVYPAA